MWMRSQVFGLIVAMVLAAPAFLTLTLPVSFAQSTIETVLLDRLFAELKAAPNSAAAQRISDQIWRVWTMPDDPKLAQRMSGLLALRARGNPLPVVMALDGIVADFPDYAEGWNQRATMHFVMGNLSASLSDIEQVLAREPRHFGALAGRALIHRAQGENALALEAMRAALEIHPFLSERGLFPELSQELIRA